MNTEHESPTTDAEAVSTASLGIEKVGNMTISCDFVKKAELSAVITRADGRIEDLGLIASSDPNNQVNNRNRS